MKALQELEANVGASNLLFQHDVFKDLTRQYKTGMPAVLAMAQTVGASIHATFRRYVIDNDGATAGVVLDLSPCSRDPLGYQRHEMVRSSKWEQDFGLGYWPTVLYSQPFSFIHFAQEAAASRTPVRTEFSYSDLSSKPVFLIAELYSNTHRIFVLVWRRRRERLRRRLVVPGDV